MTRTIDPDCRYIKKDDASATSSVSALLKCERNFSNGNIKGQGVGEIQESNRSLSKVKALAPSADVDDIINKFDERVLSLISPDKKKTVAQALLALINEDKFLDGEKSEGFTERLGKTKNALLAQSEFVLAELLTRIAKGEAISL